jgi:hypothetical protein
MDGIVLLFTFCLHVHFLGPSNPINIFLPIPLTDTFPFSFVPCIPRPEFSSLNLTSFDQFVPPTILYKRRTVTIFLCAQRKLATLSPKHALLFQLPPADNTQSQMLISWILSLATFSPPVRRCIFFYSCTQTITHSFCKHSSLIRRLH